jgi:hypothetical protein
VFQHAQGQHLGSPLHSTANMVCCAIVIRITLGLYLPASQQQELCPRHNYITHAVCQQVAISSRISMQVH